MDNLKINYTAEEIKRALERKKELLNQSKHLTRKQLDEIYHHKQTGRYLGDLVYGANDGIVTTFAVVTGAIGASLSAPIIIILGFANLLADGFSMAASSFLSKKADLDYGRAQREKELWEIENLPEVEVVEVREIFAKMGFKGADLDRATEITISDKNLWLEVMMIHELGILPDPESQPWKHGLATFIAFLVAGLAPLLPFVIPQISAGAIVFSPIFAAVALFVSGALRTLITPKTWWVGGFEMFLVGGLAAIVSLVAGFVLKSLFGVAL